MTALAWVTSVPLWILAIGFYYDHWGLLAAGAAVFMPPVSWVFPLVQLVVDGFEPWPWILLGGWLAVVAVEGRRDPTSPWYQPS